MKKRYLLFGLLLLAVGTILGRTILQPDPPEPVYLPADSVKVEVVPQSFLDKLAAAESLNGVLTDENGVLTYENGQLRDENGRLLQTAQSLSVNTGAVDEPEEITEFLERTCGQPIKRQYMADMQAFQFSGLNEDGDMTYGWKGKIGCFMRVDDGTPRRDVHAPDWMPIVIKPFSLSHVEAQTTIPPLTRKRASRWYIGMQYSVYAEEKTIPLATYIFDDVPNRISSTLNPTRFRLYAGRTWLPRKRHQIRTGVFAESGATGLDLSMSF